ncbi:MAG: hypothetical protein H8E31_15825, partial [Planctomycetes bacterium]|nr:hypothetical protein [Planctomycetota bacterium]
MLSALVLGFLPAVSPQGFDPDPGVMADRWVVVYNRPWPDPDGNGVCPSEGSTL